MIFKDQDMLSGSFLIVFSLIGFFFASQLENLAVADLSAAFYPSLLFSALLICGITLVVQGFRKKIKTALPTFNWKQLVPMFTALFLYVQLMDYIGFLVATILFVFSAMFIFGERRKRFLFTVPILTATIVYGLFSTAFMIVLP